MKKISNRHTTEYRRVVHDVANGLQGRRLFFFFGAGVSRGEPSNLPLSDDLKYPLIDCMLSATDRVGLAHLVQIEDLRKSLSAQPLERILDALVRAWGDSALEYLSVLRSDRWNVNHGAIAILARKGLLPYVVTLNFDLLIETALNRLNVPFILKLPLSSFTASIGKGSPLLTLVKPHGSLPITKDTPIGKHLAATLRYTGKNVQPENRHELESIARQCPFVVVAGYRNGDWDIFPLLEELNLLNIVWIMHPDPQTEPLIEVTQWLKRTNGYSSLITVDVSDFIRDLFKALRLKLPRLPANGLTPKPNVRPFLSKPHTTAWSAVSLLDGYRNDLYKELLPALGDVSALQADERIRPLWQRSMAWFHQTHRDFRASIALRREAFKVEFKERTSASIDTADDFLSLFYDHLSSAKRPYINPLWIVDIGIALWYRRKTRREAFAILRNHPDSITTKEVNHIIAMTEYYVVDLFHNWFTALLILGSRKWRKFVSIAFRPVALGYRKVMKKHEHLDWEYHYLRKLEAEILAELPINEQVEFRKVERIKNMFSKIGNMGHVANSIAVQALYEALSGNNSKAREHFREAERIVLKDEGPTTPTGRLRFILFKRYVFPQDTSAVVAFRHLCNLTKRQEQLHNKFNNIGA